MLILSYLRENFNSLDYPTMTVFKAVCCFLSLRIVQEPSHCKEILALIWVLEINAWKCPFGSKVPNTHFLLELPEKGNSTDPKAKEIYQTIAQRCLKRNGRCLGKSLEVSGGWAGILRVGNTKICRKGFTVIPNNSSPKFENLFVGNVSVVMISFEWKQKLKLFGIVFWSRITSVKRLSQIAIRWGMN